MYKIKEEEDGQYRACQVLTGLEDPRFRPGASFGTRSVFLVGARGQTKRGASLHIVLPIELCRFLQIKKGDRLEVKLGEYNSIVYRKPSKRGEAS